MKQIAIVGAGAIGAKRAEALVGVADLVAVIDNNLEAAERLAIKMEPFFGRSIEITNDWHSITNPLDALIIATPHKYLAEIACDAINCGVHCFIEKPGVISWKQLADLGSSIKHTDVILRFGFNHRFHRALLKAKMILSEGTLGELMYVRGRYGHGGRVGYEAEWRFDKTISGGGELIDQGAHLIDLSLWVLGEDFELVSGQLTTSYWPMAVEDNAFMTLVTPSKKVAFLHASCSEWKNLFSFEIYGKVGKLAVEGLGGSYGVERLTLYRMLPHMGPPDVTTWEYLTPDDSWRIELLEFIKAVQGQAHSPDLACLDDVEKTFSVIDQLYKEKQCI